MISTVSIFIISALCLSEPVEGFRGTPSPSATSAPERPSFSPEQPAKKLAGGNAFLKKTEATAPQFVNQSMLEMRFLQEVRGFVGKGPMDAQLPAIKKALEPMWLSLPKNEQGRLGTAQVRYALHRFFVQRHGWHIDGLDRHASEATPAGILRERVPAFLMELFEEAFGKSGLMLHELAIFAATLEHMIHDEATDRLMDVYKAYGISSQERIPDAQVYVLLKAYLMSLILGQQSLSSPEEIERGVGKLSRTWPSWSDSQMWLQDVKETVAYLNQGSTNPFSQDKSLNFQEVERISQQMSESLGSFQDTDCRVLKDQLLEREERDSGRLLLSDFYKMGMEGSMQFVEKPEYLRQLGALDESKPGEPRVIVANYVLSQGLCLADMGFYRICCINECESLMAQVEQKIAAPEATPAQLAAVVGSLSSSTVEASGVLSEKDARRLQQIAAINRGGVVPLHGRLFAQWMHSLFPRECPVPHAGATEPISTSEWMEQTGGTTATYKRNEMQKYVETAHKQAEATQHVEAESEDLHWFEEEDILYLPGDAAKGVASSSAVGFLGKLALLLVFGAAVVVAGVDKARRSSCLANVGIGKEKVQLV